MTSKKNLITQHRILTFHNDFILHSKTHLVLKYSYVSKIYNYIDFFVVNPLQQLLVSLQQLLVCLFIRKNLHMYKY